MATKDTLHKIKKEEIIIEEEDGNKTINEFILTIFRLIVEGQDDQKVIKALQFLYCSLYYEWKGIFDKKINPKDDSYFVIDKIHNLITEDDDDDQNKITRILDCIMDSGRELYIKK